MIGTPLEVYSEPISLETARLFGEINSINLNDKKIYCRPHNISIVDKSNMKAKVIESKFLGSYYKIIAKFKTDKIVLFNQEEIKKNTIIYLKVKQKLKINTQISN